MVDEAYVDFAAELHGVSEDTAQRAGHADDVQGYSLAGLRFGFAVGHPDLIAGLIKVKDSYNADAVAIAAAPPPSLIRISRTDSQQGHPRARGLAAASLDWA